MSKTVTPGDLDARPACPSLQILLLEALNTPD
jgi:hypothetical protein